MTAIRQDAWSEDDDLILAEVTLRHIREGGTQLSAFEEVGERIGRTAAACGFRWNSFVRKKYDAAIHIAKAQRQKRSQLKKHAPVAVVSSAIGVSTLDSSDLTSMKSDTVTEETLSIDSVIRFLRQWKTTYSDMTRQIRSLERELHEKQDEMIRIRKENDKLNRQVNDVEMDYRVVNDDYKALIQIMDRARKMTLLADVEEDTKPRFKMDANGNLERIE
ncbi:RsfA family transcriptional regulator [Paenibacillus sp. KN14-4R]|uniref:RsfA family transcriptional regulator n=1 Tax=Paenibacillus sp. KN14-4R TaxID=3445773 RepID=UPI003F9F79D9